MTEYKVFPIIIAPNPDAPAPVSKISPALLKAVGDAMKKRIEEESRAEARKRLGLTALVLACGAASFGGAYLLAHRR
ncbi:MAG: hypothetical protein GX886_10565 [Comamonadaceae bacterium]|jgi:hypothetical protein|nr:hypothetical protein [Comamonadaceae bacterium]